MRYQLESIDCSPEELHWASPTLLQLWFTGRRWQRSWTARIQTKIQMLPIASVREFRKVLKSLGWLNWLSLASYLGIEVVLVVLSATITSYSVSDLKAVVFMIFTRILSLSYNQLSLQILLWTMIWRGDLRKMSESLYLLKCNFRSPKWNQTPEQPY